MPKHRHKRPWTTEEKREAGRLIGLVVLVYLAWAAGLLWAVKNTGALWGR